MSTQKTFHPTHPTNEPSLSNEAVQAAKDELVKDVSEFPRVNRRFVDPPRAGEPKFALFSYIDHPDVDMIKFLDEIKDSLKPKYKKQLTELQARPQLVKGVGKIRGAYVTQQEAETRAEEIVRDIDSANSVFTCIVGVPFPLLLRGCPRKLTRSISNSRPSTRSPKTCASSVRRIKRRWRISSDARRS